MRVSLVLAVFALVTLPGAVSARGNGGKVLLAPNVSPVYNSQTISLLAGYTNIDPTGTGGPEIAIVDNMALESASRDAEVFVELGKSGTGQISVYVVREGDTLSEIADMFDVSVNTIVWANDITKGNIRPGQELVILPISGVRHVVKKGDTLSSIASKYEANLDGVLAFNGLSSSSKIKVGDLIVVPDGEISHNSPAKALSKSTTSSAGSTQKYVTTEISGYYVRPISGGRKSQGLHGHNGVDLAAPTGTPIVASASGKVIIAKGSGWNGGYGSYIVVSHANGTQTLYGHMSRVDVSVGEQVSQGEVIGAVGNTGRSTGPHIHFEVRGAKNPF